MTISTFPGALTELIEREVPDITLPVECSGEPVTLTLTEPQMKFLYSAIGRVLADNVAARCTRRNTLVERAVLDLHQ